MSYQVQFPRLPADGAATTQPMVLLQNSAVPGVTFSITPEHYQSLLAAQQQQIQTQTQQNVQVQVVRPAPPAPPVPMSAVSASGSAADSPDEEQEPRQRGSKKTKIFNCPYCDRTFTRKHNLLSHELTHSGEKLHKCEFCDLTFARKHDRNRHQRLHNGTNPYVCDKCGQSWPRSDALKRHTSSERGRQKCSSRRNQILGPLAAATDIIVPPAPAPPAPVPLSVARATTPSLEPATAAVTQPSQPPYQGYYTVPAPIVQLAQGGYEYRYLDPNQTLNPSVTYYQPVSNYYFAANLATEPTAESEDAQDEAVVTEQPDPVQPVEAAEEFEENEEEEESDDEVEVREPPQPGQESPSAGYLAALTSAAAAAAAAETR